MKKMITLLLLCFTFLGIPTFATEINVVNNGKAQAYIKVENKTKADILVEVEATDKFNKTFFYGACLAIGDEYTDVDSDYESFLNAFISFKIKTKANVKIEYRMAHSDLIVVVKDLVNENTFKNEDFIFADLYVIAKHQIKNNDNTFTKIKIALSEISNEMHSKHNSYLDIKCEDKDNGIIVGRGYYDRFNKLVCGFKILVENDFVIVEVNNFTSNGDIFEKMEKRDVNDKCKQLAVSLSSALFYRLDN